MKKTNLLLSILLLFTLSISSCSDDDKDREKIVELTLYPETGYPSLSESGSYGDVIMFSDSQDKKIRPLTNTITEGNSIFDYRQGYEYKYKAKKVWMKNPPQDVSSVKYVILELLSKRKVITEDSETAVELFVSGEIVKYWAQFSGGCSLQELIAVYAYYADAMVVINTATKETLMLPKIEGFELEEGYKYTLSAKKVVTAEPYYAVKYVLTEVLSKEKIK